MAIVQLDLHLFHTDARKFSLFYFDPEKERTIQDVLEKICSVFEIYSTFGAVNICDEVAVMCEGFYLHPSLPSCVILNCTSILLLCPVKVTVLSSSSTDKDHIKTRIDVVCIASEDAHVESNGTADLSENIIEEQYPPATQTKAVQCSLVSGKSLKTVKEAFTSNETCDSSCKDIQLSPSPKNNKKVTKRETKLLDAFEEKGIRNTEENHVKLSNIKNTKLKKKSLSSDASSDVFYNATLISAPSVLSGSPVTYLTSLCTTSPISGATPCTDACSISSVASVSTTTSPSTIASCVTGVSDGVETHDPFLHSDDFSFPKMTTNEANKYRSEDEVNAKMNLSSVSSPKTTVAYRTSVKVKPKRRRKHNKRLKKEKKKLQEIGLANCASTVLTAATENIEERRIQNVDYLRLNSKKEYIKVKIIDPNKFKKEKCSIIPYEGKKIVFDNAIAAPCQDDVPDANLCDSKLLVTDKPEMVSNGAMKKCSGSANIIEREDSDTIDESGLCQTAKKESKETLKYFIASRLQKTLEKHSDVPDDNKIVSEEFTIPAAVPSQSGQCSTSRKSNKEKKLRGELKEDSNALVKRSIFNQSPVLSSIDTQVNGGDTTGNSESMLCYDQLPNHSTPAIVCEDNFKMLIELQKSNAVAVFKYDRSSMHNTRNDRKDKRSGSGETKPLSQNISKNNRSHENMLKDAHSSREGNSQGWFPFRTPPNPTPFPPPSIEVTSKFFFLSSIEDTIEPLTYYRRNAYGNKKDNNEGTVYSAPSVTLVGNGYDKTVYNHNVDQMSLNEKPTLNIYIGTSSFNDESCIKEGETILIPTVADEQNGKDKCLNILRDRNSLPSHIPKLNNSYQSAIDKSTAPGELTPAEDTSHSNSKLIDGANKIPLFIGAAARKNRGSGVKRPRAIGVGDVLQRLRNEKVIYKGVCSEFNAEHRGNSCEASFPKSVNHRTKYNGFINQSEGENDCKKSSMKCFITEKAFLSTSTTSLIENVGTKKRQRGKRVRSRQRSTAVGSPHSGSDKCDNNYKGNHSPSSSDIQMKPENSTTYWDMTPEEYFNKNTSLKVSSCSTAITNTEKTQEDYNIGQPTNLSSKTIASLPLLTTEPHVGDIVLFYHAGDSTRDVSNAICQDDHRGGISRRGYDDGNCENFLKCKGGRKNSSNSGYEADQINTKDEEMTGRITISSRSHHKQHLKSNIKLESKVAPEEEATASRPRLLGRVTAMHDGIVSLQLVERSVYSNSCKQLVDLTGPDDADEATLTLPWTEALEARLVFP